MEALQWNENEIDYSQCLVDFEKAPKEMSEIMIKTLLWQWENDSLAAQAPPVIIAPFEPCIEVWEAEVSITNNECLTPDHQVLTPNGWIDIEKATIGTLIAQWDYGSNHISFVNPSRTICKDYDGEVYEFSSTINHINQKVTGKHRIPVVYPYTNYKSSPETRLAEEIKLNGSLGIPLSGCISSGQGMSAKEKFLVAVQADGTLCEDKYTGKNTGTLHYTFRLTKQRKIDRLFHLCKEAGFQITENNLNTREDNQRLFRVLVPVEDYCKEAKTFDWFDLQDISYEWCLDFIEELTHWDGNVTQVGLKRYINTNKSCIEKAQTIAHLAGYRTHIYTMPARENVTMPRGNISNTKECYQLSFVNQSYAIGNSIIKTSEYYSGKVYCLTVPYSYFLVKRNGVISITGNCIHGNTYSEIVRMSFKDPNKVLADLLTQKEVFERSTTFGKTLKEIKVFVTKLAYDKVMNNSLPSEYELRKYQILYYFIMLCLERIQFMASFAITFTICQTGYFMPIGSAVMKICQDELEIHSEYRKEVLKELLKDDLGKQVWNDILPLVTEILENVIEEDHRWTREFIFENGTKNLIGTNQDLVCNFVLFCAKDVANTFKIKTKFSYPKSNPMPHLEDWMNLAKVQQAPQEQDIVAYIKNTIDRSDELEVFEY